MVLNDEKDSLEIERTWFFSETKEVGEDLPDGLSNDFSIGRFLNECNEHISGREQGPVSLGRKRMWLKFVENIRREKQRLLLHATSPEGSKSIFDNRKVLKNSEDDDRKAC